MVHVLLVGTSPSWSCVIDSVMSNMAGSLCRDLAFLPAPVAALRPVEFIGDLRITVRASTKWSSSPLKHSAASGGAVGSGWDLCSAGYTTRFLLGSPDDQMSIAALEGSLSLSLGMMTRLRCPLRVW